MVKIETLKAALSLGDYGDCIVDYDSGYISDIFTEIADNHTSIYYSDIKAFVCENIDAFEDAINEFGWVGDFYKMGQLAECLKITNDLYAHENDIIELFAYHYIVNILGIDTLDDLAADALETLLLEYDTTSRLEDLADEIINIFFEEVE